MTDLDKLFQLASADTISDEMLAAYIDGNTTAEENAMIESSVPMEDLNDISEIVADTQSFEEQLHFYDGDYGFWKLGINPVLDINEDMIDIASPKYDNLFSQINHDDVYKNETLRNTHISEPDERENQEHEELEDHIEEDDFEELMEEDN